MRKRLQSISLRLQAVVGLMVVILVAAGAVSATQAYERRQQAERVVEITKISRSLFAAMQSLRLERAGVSAQLMQAGLPDPVDRANETGTRDRSESAMDDALAKLSVLAGAGDDYGLATIRARRAALESMRATTDAALAQPKDNRPAGLAQQWVAADTGLTDALSQTSRRLSSEVGGKDPFIASMMNIGQLAWWVRDAAGTDMLRIGDVVAGGKPLTPEQRDEFNVLAGKVEAPWAVLEAETQATAPRRRASRRRSQTRTASISGRSARCGSRSSTIWLRGARPRFRFDSSRGRTFRAWPA